MFTVNCWALMMVLIPKLPSVYFPRTQIFSNDRSSIECGSLESTNSIYLSLPITMISVMSSRYNFHLIVLPKVDWLFHGVKYYINPPPSNWPPVHLVLSTSSNINGTAGSDINSIIFLFPWECRRNAQVGNTCADSPQHFVKRVSGWPKVVPRVWPLHRLRPVIYEIQCVVLGLVFCISGS